VTELLIEVECAGMRCGECALLGDREFGTCDLFKDSRGDPMGLQSVGVMEETREDIWWRCPDCLSADRAALKLREGEGK